MTEGATKLIHGVLPYGHMPGDVIERDTYPLLSYALYAPIAAVAPQSSWAALGIERLQPLSQACLLALIVSAAVRFRRNPELANDRTRITAIAAAILIGLQLVAGYWAFLYLVWVVPLWVQ